MQHRPSSKKHWNWKGSNAGINSIHRWVRRRKIKPEYCELCKIVPPKDLANISHKYNPDTYTRDVSNWNWLCRKCHMTIDGRLDNLPHRGYPPKGRKCTICENPHIAKGFCMYHYNINRRGR